jgi:hypothetical protein
MASKKEIQEVKVNYLTQIIEEHPNWGSSKLQNAVKEQFGSALNKQMLLNESAKYRHERGIASPKEAQKDYRKLDKVLEAGHYIEAEKHNFFKTVSRYSAQGRENFVNSQALSGASNSHRDWIDSLIKEAEKLAKPGENAEKTVIDRLEQLVTQGSFDPLSQLSEQEKADTVFSGIVKIRKLNRDYTEQRRAEAERKRDQASEKVLSKNRKW